MVRSPAPPDIFNAIADTHRRDILDMLVGGEMPVGAIVDDLEISQPRGSKPLRVLSQVGLVQCRAVGRRRLYRLNPACLSPLHEWGAKYELMLNERLDRLDNYLIEIQRPEHIASNEAEG